jgi:hypothetical protein
MKDSRSSARDTATNLWSGTVVSRSHSFHCALWGLPALAIISLAACSRSDDARLEALEKRITKLEAKAWVDASTAPTQQSPAPQAQPPVASDSVHSTQPAKPVPEAPPQIRTLNFSGTGQQATSTADFEKALYVFKLTHSGQKHFGVWLVDSSGNKVELLANTAGPFSGSKAVQIPAKGRYLLDVSADGEWSIAAGAP